jgi:hypothetical protein
MNTTKTSATLVVYKSLYLWYMSYELFNLKIISVRYINHIKNHITLILGKNQDNKCHISVFGSVVAVTFQSVFHSKIYQNNNFFIF